MSAEDDPWVTTAQAAAIAGVRPATWRKYVSDGLAPKADDPQEDVPANRRNPRWRRSRVEQFRDNRVGQGRRSDLAREE